MGIARKKLQDLQEAENELGRACKFKSMVVFLSPQLQDQPHG
jgi:hypothetical protein